MSLSFTVDDSPRSEDSDSTEVLCKPYELPARRRTREHSREHPEDSVAGEKSEVVAQQPAASETIPDAPNPHGFRSLSPRLTSTQNCDDEIR